MALPRLTVSMTLLVELLNFPIAVAIEQEQVALLAASDDQVSYRTGRLIHENGCRTGSEIGVIGVERRLIERSEVIRHGERWRC